MSHRVTHLTHDDETICPDCGMDISQWHEAPCPKMQQEIEKLARRCHEVYQTEAKRQRDSGELSRVDDALADNEPSLRHPDDYGELSKEFKNFDRALARFILTNFETKEDVEIWISKRPKCGNCGATLFCEKCEPIVSEEATTQPLPIEFVRKYYPPPMSRPTYYRCSKTDCTWTGSSELRNAPIALGEDSVEFVCPKCGYDVVEVSPITTEIHNIDFYKAAGGKREEDL